MSERYPEPYAGMPMGCTDTSRASPARTAQLSRLYDELRAAYLAGGEDAVKERWSRVSHDDKLDYIYRNWNYQPEGTR